MEYPVQGFNYDGLVREMAEVGLENMAEVLNEILGSLPKPKWKNEKEYFWKALFNSARKEDAVWLWLMTQPHIRQIAPPEAEFHTSGRFVDELDLPGIGGPDDRPVEKE